MLHGVVPLRVIQRSGLGSPFPGCGETFLEAEPDVGHGHQQRGTRPADQPGGRRDRQGHRDTQDGQLRTSLEGHQSYQDHDGGDPGDRPDQGMRGVPGAERPAGGFPELPDDRLQRAHRAPPAARVRRAQGRCRVGGIRTALKTSAARLINSCSVTVACQYCQPANRPLGMVVPVAWGGLR